jgi:hypothetical protein
VGTSIAYGGFVFYGGQTARANLNIENCDCYNQTSAMYAAAFFLWEQGQMNLRDVNTSYPAAPQGATWVQLGPQGGGAGEGLDVGDATFCVVDHSDGSNIVWSRRTYLVDNCVFTNIISKAANGNSGPLVWVVGSPDRLTFTACAFVNISCNGHQGGGSGAWIRMISCYFDMDDPGKTNAADMSYSDIKRELSFTPKICSRSVTGIVEHRTGCVHIHICSALFTASASFAGTNAILATKAIESSKCFSGSAELTSTGVFSSTSRIDASGIFGRSGSFDSTMVMLQSSEWTSSAEFTGTGSFSSTGEFSGTESFSSSADMSDTMTLKQTNGFNPSDSLKRSE